MASVSSAFSVLEGEAYAESIEARDELVDGLDDAGVVADEDDKSDSEIVGDDGALEVDEKVVDESIRDAQYDSSRDSASDAMARIEGRIAIVRGSVIICSSCYSL
jgi:hypothetical protein